MAEKEEKKAKTLGEKMYTWAKVVGVLIPLVGVSYAGISGWFKGDDAQQNIDHLIQQLGERVAKQERVINTQSEKLEKMARRMIFFQGHQAGVSAGKLFIKQEQTEQALHKCIATNAKKGRVKKSDLEDMIGAAVKRVDSRPRHKPTKPQGIPRLQPRPFRKKNGDK